LPLAIFVNPYFVLDRNMDFHILSTYANKIMGATEMSRTKSETKPTPTGKQIKKALIDLDMRPFDLAKDLGVSTLYIRMITNEKRTAVETRKKIACILTQEYRRYGYPLPGWAREINASKGA
jgi:hypothetical protein